MKGFFKKPRRLWVHITGYTLLTLVLLVGLFVTLKSYEKNQPIVMRGSTSMSAQELIDTAPMEATETDISQLVTQDDLSRLFFGKLKDYNPPLGKDLTLDAYHFDTEEGVSYFNFTDSKENLYSLVARTELGKKDDKITLSLSDFKLGKYKIGFLGKFYSQRLDITDEITLDFNDLDEVVYINQIDVNGSNEIICHYGYNIPHIRNNFKAYKDQLDHRKMDIYAKEEPQVKEFTQMLENLEGYSEEGIVKWMSTFQSDRQALENCALILKDDGVKNICSDFQILHNGTLQPERLIELSQNELDYALMQYHRDFSRMLLNYLYQNRGYSYTNGQITVNGSSLDAGTILQQKGKASLYDVKVVTGAEGISAHYYSGDDEIQKLILRKE